jgi:hypothetical protein
VIQYEPTTKDVHAEPLLIVPAWIMKYYILDLSPRNSMVKYLVDQGHTVFMMSWKNPDEGDRDLGMEDYVEQGLRAAIDAVATIVPKQKMHAVGYCIGGTLLAIGAAILGRAQDERLASVTMFAAQTDFSEPGELAFFINPGQLATLDATMAGKGVLESRQMGGAFALLRGQDLVWQPLINNYLKGKRDPMIDLMAWNADGTRMPWRMHTEYLNRLYLKNELATNRFMHDGQRVRLSDIRLPMFVVGTEADHVAPWTSVYKVDNLVRSDDFTFLLTAGGHNAGIICGPVHPKRSYKVRTRRLADPLHQLHVGLLVRHLHALPVRDLRRRRQRQRRVELAGGREAPAQAQRVVALHRGREQRVHVGVGDGVVGQVEAGAQRQRRVHGVGQAQAQHGLVLPVLRQRKAHRAAHAGAVVAQLEVLHHVGPADALDVGRQQQGGRGCHAQPEESWPATGSRPP